MNSTILSNNGSMSYCECTKGYEGNTCQFRVNYCVNVTCANKGVCKTINMTWKCICLGDDLYNGDHCQYRTGTLKVKEAMSRSFAGVAITAIVLTCSFVVSMDVLKYVFRIDPVKLERQYIRAKKKRKIFFHPSGMALRFQYVP